ncbi:MAG: WD40/YVTN/BNR-like repeat-containing protein, partial [Candidatus Binatia bacterium]
MHRATVSVVVATLLAACHADIESVPLAQQNIYFSDKFYDVAALGPEHAIVVGYGGKALETKDGGLSFTRLNTGTDLALFDVTTAGSHIWIAGQEGMILHSGDGGKTFEQQKSGTPNYLFAIHFLNENRGFAVGDKSALTETVDGGKTWTARTLEVA